MLRLIEDPLMIETRIITFDSTYPHYPSALKYVVGSTKWNLLTTVDFQFLDTDKIVGSDSTQGIEKPSEKYALRPFDLPPVDGLRPFKLFIMS